MGLREVALVGIRAQFYFKLLNVSLTQISSILLAILLLPTDFATVGVAMVFIGFGSRFAELELGSTLIRRRNEYEVALETALTLRYAFATLVLVTLFLLAP